MASKKTARPALRSGAAPAKKASAGRAPGKTRGAKSAGLKPSADAVKAALGHLPLPGKGAASAGPKVLILGGTSDIARAVAFSFAERGFPLVLAARDVDEATRDAADLFHRTGAAVDVVPFEAENDGSIRALLENLADVPLCGVVSAVGALGDESAADDPDRAASLIQVNLTAPVRVLTALAPRLVGHPSLPKGRPAVVGISSVAGDRGRRSNYWYGAPKAGFTAFLSGLHARLYPCGVAVVNVKPGFVRTRMIAGKKTPKLLTAEPREVADAVWSALEARRHVVYVRPAWRLILLVVRHLPESIFRRLSL